MDLSSPTVGLEYVMDTKPDKAGQSKYHHHSKTSSHKTSKQSLQLVHNDQDSAEDQLFELDSKQKLNNFVDIKSEVVSYSFGRANPKNDKSLKLSLYALNHDPEPNKMYKGDPSRIRNLIFCIRGIGRRPEKLV